MTEKPPVQLPDVVLKAIEDRDWKRLQGELAKPGDWHKDANAFYWSGMAHYMQGNHVTAVDIFWKAWKLEPDHYEVAMILMQAAVDYGEYRRASAVAAHFPNDGAIRHYAGMANIAAYINHRSEAGMSGKLGTLVSETLNKTAVDARRHLLAAERLGYDEARNHRALAYVHNQSGEHEDAVEHARRAIELDVVGAEVYMILASSLIQSGRHLEAVDAYAQANRMAPHKTAYFEYERGQALHKAGYFSEATEAFLNALAADKYHNRVRYWIGKSAYDAGNYRLAIWAFGESANIDSNVSGYYMLGRCAYDLENDALAEHYLRRAMDKGKRFFSKKGSSKIKTPPPMWSHYLGRVLWAQGKKKEALEHLRRALSDDQDNLLFARWLFQCYLEEDDPHGALGVCRIIGKAGNYDDAMKGIEVVRKKWPRPRMKDRAARKPPHVALAAVYVAEIAYANHRYHEAAAFYDRMRLTRGKFARIEAGWALAQTGRFSDAEQCFRDYVAHREEKDHRFGRYGLAYALAWQGKHEEAKQQIEQIPEENWSLARQSMLLWCARQSGDVETAKKLADPYTALGIYSYRTRKKGHRMVTMLPGSSLAKAEPQLLPRDIIRRVGEHYLGGEKLLQTFRSSPLTSEPINVLIWRGSSIFEVSVNLNPTTEP